MRTLLTILVQVRLAFHVQDTQGRDFMQGCPGSPLAAVHATGIARWRRMVGFVRAVNALFNGFPMRASLYDLNLLNPLNLVPLRWLSVLFGVSRECWDDIIVPVYASTFLSVRLDSVPAIILPLISDIIPFMEPAMLRSWTGSSQQVFERMLPRAGACSRTVDDSSTASSNGTDDTRDASHVTVHLETHVWSVEQGDNDLWWVNGTHGPYDRVVFASSAKNVRECTGALPQLLRRLFDGIAYTQEEDRSMTVGHIHSDASILPFPSAEPCQPTSLRVTEAKATTTSTASTTNANAKAAATTATMVITRESLLANSANFIRAQRSADGSVTYANTFILSSWIPALGEHVDGRNLPRMVTYGALKGSSDEPRADAVVGTVVNEWNHPALSPATLACQFMMRAIQGRRGVYFCGSLATPGNGHDLSLCSGLAVAEAIGAQYPFGDDEACRSDLDKLIGLMGLKRER